MIEPIIDIVLFLLIASVLAIVSAGLIHMVKEYNKHNPFKMN